MSAPRGLTGSPKDVARYVKNERTADGEGATGYYEKGGAPSQWSGELAKELGLAGTVDTKDLLKLLDGETPDGTRFTESSPDRRMAGDIVFSAPKGVSLAICASDLPQDIKDAMREAHHEAVIETQQHIEREVLCARYGKGGTEAVHTGQALWATYGHEDARPVDGKVTPSIHDHCLLLNVTKGVNGELRALDLQFGEHGILLCGAIYRSIFASKLRAQGHELRRTKDGFDLASVTDAQIRAASPRSSQIEDRLAEQGLTRESASATQITAAQQSTRESKKTLSRTDQLWEWRALARQIDLRVDQPAPTREQSPEATQEAARASLKYATDHLSERESVISEQAVRLHALTHGVISGVTSDALSDAIRQAQRSGHIYKVSASELVTHETLSRESSILHTLGAGKGTHSPLTNDPAAIIADREASQGFNFTPGQKAAISLALTTQDQSIGIVGAAGSGKTTAIALIAGAAKTQGYRVVGLGPMQSAVDNMHDAGCDDTRTLASFCERNDQDTSPRLIVLDEAGMVSARDAERMLQKIGRQDRVIFLGDPKQLDAVEAGAIFAQAMNEHAIDYREILEINRQKNPKLLQVATAFAKGENRKAVDLAEKYMTAVTVTPQDYECAGLAPDPKKAPPPAVRAAAIARQTAADYLALTPDERAHSLVLSGTNVIRREINSFIREGLQKAGDIVINSVTVTALDKAGLTRAQAREAINYEVGMVLRVSAGRGKDRVVSDYVITATDPTANTVTGQLQNGIQKTFKTRQLDPKKSALYTPRALDLATGDRIVFTENNRDNGFSNNQTGTVTVTTTDRIEVKKDNGQVVNLATNSMHTVDHGWALTVHRSQGRTIDRVLVAGMSARMATAKLAYVACTRMRYSLSVITDDIKNLKESWTRTADRKTARDVVGISTRSDDLKKARTKVKEAEQPKVIQRPEAIKQRTHEMAKSQGRGWEMEM